MILNMDGSRLISVADNGKGFEPPADAGMGGHGLASMRRRAKSLGGSLTIDSRAGDGTTVTLKVPVRQKSRWRFWFTPHPNGQ